MKRFQRGCSLCGGPLTVVYKLTREVGPPSGPIRFHTSYFEMEDGAPMGNVSARLSDRLYSYCKACNEEAKAQSQSDYSPTDEEIGWIVEAALAAIKRWGSNWGRWVDIYLFDDCAEVREGEGLPIVTKPAPAGPPKAIWYDIPVRELQHPGRATKALHSTA